MRKLALLSALLLVSCNRPHPAPAAATEAQTVSAADLANSVVLNVALDKLEGWRFQVQTTYTDGDRACGLILGEGKLKVFYSALNAPLGIFEPGKSATADACAKLATPYAGGRR